MSLDNYDLWVKHDLEQQRRLDRMPRCCHCGEKIQDDDLFDIFGGLYHIECAEDEFMPWSGIHGMTKFIAQLNGGDYINIRADEMRMESDFVAVYRCGNLVALVDKSVILTAHLSEKSVSEDA